MITHIVFIRFLGYSEEKKLELSKDLASMLNDLAEKIDIIQSLEVGFNFNSRPSAFDLALTVQLKTKEDIDVYRNHPEHVKVLNFMKTLKIETGVVDYDKDEE